MASVFTRQIGRSIRGSLGRFLAIMGIAALGCGFFAGLQMSGPDMRLAADRYYDGTNLYDLRIVSTLGLEQADVDRIAAIDGVGEVMPSRTADAMARVAGEQLAVRVSSIDPDVAPTSASDGTYAVASPDASYLNRLVLAEGAWPTRAGECVVSDNPAKGVVRVGDTITLLYGSDELDETFSTTTLTVTGLVRSPNYVYTGSFGSTALGSGVVAKYLYVTHDTFAEDLPYTEVFATVPAARGALSGTSAYDDALAPTKKNLESAASDLADLRLREIRDEALAKIDDAQRELDEKRADAERELADAKARLDDAKRTIDDSQAALDDGLAALEEGRRTLAARRADTEIQLDAAAAQVADGRARAQAAQASLDQAQTQLDERRAEYDAQAQAALAALAAQGISASTPAEAQAALAERTVLLDQQVAGLEAQLADLPADDQSRPALEVALQQAKAGRETLAQAKDGVDALVTGGIALDDAQGQIDAGRSQAADGLARAEQGERELSARRAEAQSALAAAQDELDANEAQLADGRAQLADARAQWEEGMAEYRRQADDARAKLDDAQSELDEARADLDGTKRPGIYVLDREKNEGAVAYRGDSERMDSIANVFPAIFFLVAALVSLTTMTRMVEDDRVEIGTYKALGYSTGRIALRYVAYAALASGAGAVIGIAVLSQVLPFIVTSSYSIIYDVPSLPFPLPVDSGTAVLTFALGVGVTLLATWGAVVSSLREVPATLMLPRAPKAGKRILLERVTPVWSRLSFSWKVTCRNLFRYKRRLLMTVVGISGCTALLLVGFGLHDSIWDIIDCQYGPIVHYDAVVSLNADASPSDVDAVGSYLAAQGDVTDVRRVQQANVLVARGSDDDAISADTYRASCVIPQDDATFGGAVTLRERRGHKPVDFGPGSVVLTEKLAKLLGVGPGDAVRVFDQDDIGNAKGEGRLLRVTGVAENYVGSYVYVGRDAWSAVDDGRLGFGTFYASVPADATLRERMSSELGGMRDVSTVSFTDEAIETYRGMLRVVDLVVVVLTVSAAALAFIVLYNLTNINVSERIREIASLKVLGFTRREVYAYIFREVAVLALLGDLLGMVLGTYLETFVITTAEVDVVMFGRTIHPTSYAYAFALTLVFTLVVVLFMRRKLDRVNMVESLKSVE